MKQIFLYLVIVAFGSMLLPHGSKAQVACSDPTATDCDQSSFDGSGPTGLSEIDYDPDAGMMYGTSITELDYNTALYYDPYVRGTVFDDASDITLDHGENYGTFFDPEVDTYFDAEVDTQTPAQDGEVYDLVSDHYLSPAFVDGYGTGGPGVIAGCDPSYSPDPFYLEADFDNPDDFTDEYPFYGQFGYSNPGCSTDYYDPLGYGSLDGSLDFGYGPDFFGYQYPPSDNPTYGPAMVSLGSTEAYNATITIRVLQDGSPVSSPKTVTVGQQINLTPKVTPASTVIQSPAWFIADHAVANYTASQSSATATSLVNPGSDPNNPAITYYWADGGPNREVNYSFTDGGSGKYFKGKAIFNVASPNLSLRTQEFTVLVDQQYFKPGWFLHFGTNASLIQSGIGYYADVTMPSGVTGNFEWVQVIRVNQRVRHFTTDIKECWNQAGLDGFYPYPTVTADMSGDSEMIAADSPGQPAYSGADYVSANDQFDTFLMFMPSAPNSIWVPLGRIQWYWAGTAAVNGSSWNYVPWSSPHGSAVSTNFNYFPQWSHVVSATDNNWSTKNCTF
jgi:hypothetical protein